MKHTPSDETWMRLAIEQAEKGLGQCSPNPAVGAVLVKNQQLLGLGHHQGAGKPHAEREAIANALKTHDPVELRGSSIYVTLEPCSTHGRTPPCCDALIEYGIARCIYGSTDPNPSHRGAANRRLKEAGIAVFSGIEEAACDQLIRGFRHFHENGLPWVISKLGMSLDGRLSRPPGESQWLTNAAAKQLVHQWRSQVDAIIVGGNTVRRDNPALTLRGQGMQGKRQPLRVVLTHHPQQIPPNSQLLTDAFADRTRLMSGLSLTDCLRHLGENEGVRTVLLEAGGQLQAAFLEANLIQEIRYFYAPLLCGGPDLAMAGAGKNQLTPTAEIKNPHWQQIEDNLLLCAEIVS